MAFAIYLNCNRSCLITGYIDDNVTNLIGNCKGNRTYSRGRTKLNTNVTLNVTSRGINLARRSKN